MVPHQWSEKIKGYGLSFFIPFTPRVSYRDMWRSSNFLSLSTKSYGMNGGEFADLAGIEHALCYTRTYSASVLQSCRVRLRNRKTIFFFRQAGYKI